MSEMRLSRGRNSTSEYDAIVIGGALPARPLQVYCHSGAVESFSWKRRSFRGITLASPCCRGPS